MFKTKVTYSTDKDAYNSGVFVAKESVKNSDVKLGLIITKDGIDNVKTVDGIKSVFGNKSIVGMSTSEGIITPDGFISGDSYVGMMSFSDDDLIVGVASISDEGDARTNGKSVARAAISNAGIKKVPSYYMVLTTGVDEVEYIKGIQDVVGNVSFFGGSPSGENPRIICNDEIISKGCAVVFFYAKNDMKTVYNGFFEQTGEVGVITKMADKRTILEINGEPALKKYAVWCNTSVDKMVGPIDLNKMYPLGVKDINGSLISIRRPLVGMKDGSIKVSNDVYENTAIIKLRTDEDKLLKSNINAINMLNSKMKSEISGYLLFENVERFEFVKNKKDVISKELAGSIKDIDFMMAFTSSEFGSFDHSASTSGSLMKSFVAFSK